MKTIKLAFLLAVSCQLCAIGSGSAQSFHVLKATSQRWAGGVAGHFGVYYSIELETSSPSISPDTVWINGQVYPVTPVAKNGSMIRSTDSVTHKIKYTISVSESHNQFNGPRYRQQENPPAKDTATEKPKPVRQFDGAAMISYRVKHKQRFFIIKSFTALKQLNYP